MTLHLLWKVERKEKKLIFFPLTSNHSHQNIIFVSQYKISSPCSPCLESILYPESFVNANRLVMVPHSVISSLGFCQKCSNNCLSKEDFEAIVKLSNDLPKHRKKIKKINLDFKDFLVNGWKI